MNLRPYQETSTAQLREGLRTHQAGLLVQPCGSGKGTQISYMVNRAVARGLSVIFAVHGKALVHDMSERVRKLGIPHGVLLGGHRRERWHSVQVASIDTLHRMQYPPKADLLIIDEAHMALSPTWRKTIEKYPSSKIIGCTATPIRLDRQGLGRQSGGLFDFMVLGPNEQELIDMGFLVPSRVLAPPPPADLGNVGKVAGEFNSKQQASVCDKAKVIGDIVEHWRKHAEPRAGATAAFGVDQAHANHIAEQFRVNGFDWAYVDAETPDVDRNRIWGDLDRRNIRGVSSVGVISVGWDHPAVDCLISARKTASLGLWKQMLGRGSRPHPGKKNFLVLDHVGNSHYHAPYGLFESAVDWQLDGEAVNRSNEKSISVSTCKRPALVNGEMKMPCYATFKTGPTECPYCGLVLLKEARKIEQVAGDLQEITSQPPAVRKENERIVRAVYESLRKTQIEKGYKEKYARAVLRSRFGIWAPKHWDAETKEKVSV